MFHRLRPLAVWGLVAALSGAAAAAQARWLKPYENGRDAVNDGKYEQGIPLLEEAIRIDSRQARVKDGGGVNQIPYFPYYFLGVAYFRTNQLDKAEEAFRNARACNCLPNNLAGLMRNYENEIALARKPAPPPPGPNRGQPPPPGPNPNFARQLGDANAAMNSGRYPDAIRLYDNLRQMDAAEFVKNGLAARRDAAARAYADQLVKQAQQLLDAGSLSEARAKFQEAEGVSSGSGQPGLEAIRKRQEDYARLKSGAEADQRAGNAAGAIDKYKQAAAADPEQYRADNLGARVQELGQGAAKPNPLEDLLRRARAQAAQRNYREAASLYGVAKGADPNNAEAKAWLEANSNYERLRNAGRTLYSDGKLQQALQSLDDARRQNEDRFNFERLGDLVNEITNKLGRLPEEQIAPVRDALVVYLQGDAARAASMLEPLAANTGLDARVRAHALAWLGVAYGDQSLSSREDAARADLRQKAVEQFKQLLTIQPEYQLQASLISPRVRDILEEARKR